MTTLRRFLEEIKIEHTLFALPFAYAGALLAARGFPSWHVLAWITVAVAGARTAAMSANRLLDASIDGRNPRTAKRALPTGALSPRVMVIACIAGIALLTLAAYELNPLCLALLPIGALGVLCYPLFKRWTWAVHFVLGAVDGLAPLGAWIAVTGRFAPGAWILFAAVTVWVAGFDILYALMDREFDVGAGVHSIPARFGEGAGRALPQVLHGALVAALVALGFVVRANPLYWAGVAAAAALLVYELLLVRRLRDDFALNAAIFNANMVFSVVFLLTTALSLSVRA
ncbi:MAG TPA: UbiA-like polyprenyltransferase [Candidatus Eremiobacteraceae bacterium]|nr:UbiA-like polyprenyltransferase [Candidatus Eremiobacteraceae bacterium]